MGDTLDPGAGKIVAVDLDREEATVMLEWLPPPALRTPAKGFTGIAWLGVPGKSDLVVCAHAALCRVDVKTWTVTGLLHQPCMNDVHHVAVHQGRLLVANTGLDRVDVFDATGTFCGGWDLSPAWIATERLGGCNPSRESWAEALRPGWTLKHQTLTDDPFPDVYDALTSSSLPFPIRKIRDFVHPNHIAVVEGQPLVTRFIDRSIQNLADWSLVVPDTPGHPHDGEFFDGRFWITCTTGLVIAYAVENGRVTPREVERIDVFERTGHSGWCRGLVVTERLIVVGLTAVQYAPPFGWSDRDPAETETSILAIDRRTLRLVSRVDLRGLGASPKMFGMLELPTLSL